MTFDPSDGIQDYLVFGEFGGVNPSITDSSTYTFMSPEGMQDMFEHPEKLGEMFQQQIEGCFIYSRHWNPINKYLAGALAALEDSDAAVVTSSGMAAISSAVLQTCDAGDEIVSGRTIYGGTYALFKNFLPRLGIKVKFVNMQDYDAVKNAMSERTKIIYCESVSNPLLQIANIPVLAKIAEERGARVFVDNTFSPMIISPLRLGAHVVLHSLTKFINGTSDCVAGCVCSDNDFINQLTDINAGASMLFGPVLDSYRAASILKNMHSLHIRVQQHSRNTEYMAKNFEKLGFKVFYPGLPSHSQHELMKELMNPGFGFGGMLAVDIGDEEAAKKLMIKMQEKKVGYLAVSLGYFKTLFITPGRSTASEIPKEEQDAMGLTDSLMRISVGIDNNIERSFERIVECLKELKLI